MSEQAHAAEATSGEAAPSLRLSVIIPARNEARSLTACLDSLLSQSERGFALGEQWELIVVDDESTDGTGDLARKAAAGQPGVSVLQAPPLDRSDRGGFTGKNNACWAGAEQARGAWLLFTDADTLHEPGDLSRALHEAEKYKAALLSYSPRQLVSGFWQHAVMPLVFSELASVYPPKQACNPASPLAAANGQFLLIRRNVYFDLGGHRLIGKEILEDVALARTVKRANHNIRFRYAPEALSTRMYSSTAEMIEGWTKNLALLFPRPFFLAAMRTLQFLLFFLLPPIALFLPGLVFWQRGAILLVWLRACWGFYNRVGRAHFPAGDTIISILGVPLFVWLLLRSATNKRVDWKGRSYKTDR
ncbi:MAG TPA: glycosyltransferase family 2 protein [Acidobacteriaceae bacterium]|nr:glycosyltransferase family 2 protein [Acidobacteriaceae bacterium]